MIDHLGITVRDHEASKAFYLQALAPLGIGDPNYYGAFVIDPNGVNFEAVCHQP